MRLGIGGLGLNNFRKTGTGGTGPIISAPVNSAVPTISGTPTQGQTLTASTGSWSNSPFSYAYQWKRSGTNISGATSSTYLLALADVGATITVAVVASNAGGAGTAATSAATAAIVAATGDPALNRNVTVLFVGGSSTVGVGADPTEATDIKGARPFSVPSKAKDWLNANGVPSIVESVAGDNAVGLTDLPNYRTDIAFTGAIATGSRTPTVGGLLFRINASGSPAITFTTSTPIDTFRFGYSSSPTSGTFQITIDGVAHSTYSAAEDDAMVFQTITGLSLATHAIKFTCSSGIVQGPAFIQAWDSTKKTVQIVNAGVRGWSTSDWVLNTYASSPRRGVPAIGPNITVIDLGINDYRQAGTSINTLKTNLQTTISSVLAVGSSVILVVPNDIQSYNTTTDAWSLSAVITAYQDLATANPGVVLVNAPAAYYAAGLSAVNPATWASLNAAGYMYDSFHPKAAVYEAEGNAVGAAIKTLCTSNGWLV